jgi:hypothetical protein
LQAGAQSVVVQLVNVQPANAVIVNTEKPNVPIEIGFAAP